MKGVYEDGFVLHDESADDFKESQKYAEESSSGGSSRPDSAVTRPVIRIH